MVNNKSATALIISAVFLPTGVLAQGLLISANNDIPTPWGLYAG